MPPDGRGVHRRPDGPHARLYERHVRGLRGPRRRMGMSTTTIAAPANLVAYQKYLARHDISLTHTIVHPTIDKSKGDVPERGRRGRAAQGRRHRARHRRARRAHPRDARAVRRRDRGVSRDAAGRGHRRLRAVVLRADGDAGPEVHLPRQLRDDAQSLSTIRCRAASTSRTRS